jgi:addiction module HigA family antidote
MTGTILRLLRRIGDGCRRGKSGGAGSPFQLFDPLLADHLYGLAKQLDVSASTLSRVLSGASRVTPEMALRLSKALGRSAESWLTMQDSHDLWVARQSLDLARVRPLEIVTA